MLLVTASEPVVKTVSIYTAFVFAILTGAVGWNWRHLRQTREDVKAARGRLANALKAVRSAWLVMLFVGGVVYIAVRYWFHKYGG